MPVKTTTAVSTLGTSDYSGDQFPVAELVDVKGIGFVHKSEFDRADVRKCVRRNTYHRLADMHQLPDGDFICDAEFNNNYGLCAHTGDVVHNDHLYEVFDRFGSPRIVQEWVRDEHYFYCVISDRHYTNDCRIRFGPEGDREYAALRELEASDDHRVCDGCGGWFHIDDLDENGLCPACSGEGDTDSDDSEDESSIFQSYNTRRYPAMRSHLTPEELSRRRQNFELQRFLGVELEVEVRSGTLSRNASAHRVRKALGDFCIYKEDGSLHNGYEIVTAPATFEFHKKAWQPFFDAEVQKGLMSDTTTAGLHVHVSKAALSELQIGKIMVFITNPAAKKFITYIARREANSYCDRAIKKHSDVTRGEGNRYQAVNLQNTATIEFRLFKGTIDKKHFFASLEFVEALIAFCSPGERGMGGHDVTGFCQYVTAQRKQYPNLFQHLVDGQYCQPPKTRTDKPAAPNAVPEGVKKTISFAAPVFNEAFRVTQ